MRKTYLVYSTDAWHSYASRDIIGVCTTFANCMKVIRADIKRNDYEKLSDDDKWDLENIKQTQGRECNYMYEEVEKNVLL